MANFEGQRWQTSTFSDESFELAEDESNLGHDDPDSDNFP
jgi:hypothetical protein